MESLFSEKLSTVQKQFYLHYRIFPESKAYHIPALLKFNNPIDPRVLKETMGVMCKRHKQLSLNTNVQLSDLPISDFSGSFEALLNPEHYGAIDIERELPFRIYYLNDVTAGYVLFIFHHLIFDLRSKEIFSKEFSDLYNALSKGEEAVLSDVCQYEDYLNWFGDFAKTDKYIKMCSYWENEPLGTSLLRLNGDRERPSAPSPRGEKIFGTFPAELSCRLQKYCGDNGSDPFLFLLTIYTVLLYRHSSQKDFSIGIPRTNRPKEEFHDIIGCFVNILPLFIHIEEQMSFTRLMLHIRIKMLEMHRNQNVPYLEVVKLKKDNIDRKYNPLFQVGFTTEHPLELNIAGNPSSQVNYRGNGSQLDMFFNYWLDNNDINWSLEYCTDLFATRRAEYFIDSFITIAEHALSDMETNIDSIPISGKKTSELLNSWNETEKEYERHDSIIEFLRDSRLRTSDATALIYNGKTISYKELNQRAECLASVLIEQGVGIETIVGLSLERSPEMVIGLMAIVLAGGSYLPIEPSLPAVYVDYILKDGNVSFLLTKKKYTDLFPEVPCRIYLEEFDYNQRTDNVVFPRIKPDNRVYILYTSGSTGQPKGVEITHRGLINRILWMDDEYNSDSKDILIQKTPFNFDVSGWEFWWPHIKGIPLVIAEPEGHKDNNYLKNIIEDHNVTIIHFVPSMLHEFLKNCGSRDSCPSLRDVICSGEALPVSVVQDFYERLPHCRLHNLYGPTEASIDVTYWPCTADCHVVPIGSPISNTQIHILDKNMHQLPPGVSGEIYLSGTGLARGYLNNQELTNERFISNPFGKGKLYKTGDIGQWTIDGEILYSGRNDDQIQLHGLRIELGEIENQIRKHPDVDTTAVAVRGDFGADQSIIAYVVCKKGLTKSALKEFILQRLPRHMVPDQLFFIDKIELNSNGKIDRKSLPAPRSLVHSSETPFSCPEGDVEEKIARLWMDMLKTDKIGRDENFFELGGTSLHMIEMQKNLSELTGLKIPITDLFSHTTVKELAQFLSETTSKNKDMNSLSRRAEMNRRAAQAIKNRRKR